MPPAFLSSAGWIHDARPADSANEDEEPHARELVRLMFYQCICLGMAFDRIEFQEEILLSQ